MNRTINKVAVLGSGIMGSGIACHFANIGVEVILLDLPNVEAIPDDVDKNSAAYRKFRNKLVDENLLKAIKSKPSPLYLKEYQKRISTGNTEDDLPLLKDCDWIIEVIIEKLQPKKDLYAKIEQFIKPGSIVSSNTSGIPINLLAEGRSENFKQHFCGTHFFNPPRYLQLLEIIPNKDTLPEIQYFILDYGRRFLGKNTVLAKDTPAFIANRIGVYSMLKTINLTQKYGFGFSVVDKITGPLIARPKSATYRTADLVGLDTLMHVLKDLKDNCPDDEMLQNEPVPDYLSKMMENNLLGSKTKQGFYKKEKDESGKSVILSLDVEAMNYVMSKKVRLPEIELLSGIDQPIERIKNLFADPGKVGDFFREMWLEIFAYASQRIPEISDQLLQIDQAIKSGFGWQIGIFETWQELGIERVIKKMQHAGLKVPAWIEEMLEKGNAFYSFKDEKQQYYSIKEKQWMPVHPYPEQISFSALKTTKTLWKNKGASIIDLGDGILNLEFHTKMNVLGSEIFEGLQKAIKMAEENYKGLVIYNEGEHFSAGANVGLIYMLAREQEIDELNLIVKQFQEVIMRIRYSSIPVVAAVHGYTFGGACEVSMHADKVIAHAETYMGLVELGVGIIPAGGGSKEFALRLSDELREGDVRNNLFRDRLLTIAQAKVSTSALEAFEYGYLRKGIDEMVIDRSSQLSYAKKVALQMYEKGYTRPIRRNDIKVMGKEGLGLVYSGADGMRKGNFISEYDQHLAEKLGYVLSGGNVSEMTEVSEAYLLKLERETFVRLCMERKTMERMHSLISTGKILRN